MTTSRRASPLLLALGTCALALATGLLVDAGAARAGGEAKEKPPEKAAEKPTEKPTEKAPEKAEKPAKADKVEGKDKAPGAATSSTPALHPPLAAATKDKCERCHQPTGWSPAKFAHDKTAFPLVGRHAGVACVQCHSSGFERPLPMSCAGCHRDPHAQEFGLLCRSCHNEESWRPLFLVDAHRRTGFPLTGRHATLPCEECHKERRERTFFRTSLDCTACHVADARRASASTVDHTRAPFSTSSCRACHEPVAFRPAQYPQHEQCFPIARGAHQAVSCAECHRSLTGVRAGGCAGVPVFCAECHTHRKAVEDRNHKDVDGYVHASERCAGCHRSG